MRKLAGRRGFWVIAAIVVYVAFLAGSGIFTPDSSDQEVLYASYDAGDTSSGDRTRFEVYVDGQAPLLQPQGFIQLNVTEIRTQASLATP